MILNIGVILEGFFTGAGLIMAIGSQNAFVLKKGIKRENQFIIALVSSVIDAILIIAGVMGLGGIINSNKMMLKAATVFGILFLLYHSIKSFKEALAPKVYKENDEYNERNGIKKSILMLLGFSLLNPHVYLDTVILLGSMGARHGTGRADFAAGAIAASVVWFFSLSYGAGMLAPIFKKKIVWQFLDFAIGVIMSLIAVNLGFFLYKI